MDYIKDIVEIQLKTYQSKTLYSPTQVLIGRKTINTLLLIDLEAELNLIDKNLIKD